MMRPISFPYLLLFLLMCLHSAVNAQSRKARILHRKATVVDTHNDVLTGLTLKGKDISHRLQEGHSDLDRWKEGRLDVQFFSVWTGETARNREGFYKDAVEQIDSLQVLTLRNYERMSLVTDYRGVKKSVRKNRLAALIGVEGGHMIENDMAKLNALYEQGMRYMTLTWNNSNEWASSAMDETNSPEKLKHKGLTDFGKQVVRRMNELGIIVDLSHTGEQTFYDAIATSSKPVMLSHSSVWAICPVFRNVKDEQIRAVAKNGGVICINFYSGFISREYDQKADALSGERRRSFTDSLKALSMDSAAIRKSWREYYAREMNNARPTLAQVVDHIDYIVHLVGDDYVGLGSDFDGVSSLPVGLEDVTTYPKITEELLRRGYSRKSIKKILGGNVLRVMKANLK